MHEPLEIARLQRNTRNSLFFATVIGVVIVVVSTPTQDQRAGWFVVLVMSVLLALCAAIYAFSRRRLVAQVSIGLQIVTALCAMGLLESEFAGSFLFTNAVFDMIRLGKWRDSTR